MQRKRKREGLLQKNSLQQSTASVVKRSRYNHSIVARLGEDAAAAWLIKNGYTVIDRNWHAGRRSEIDLVALDPRGLLTFVEVKTRRLSATADHHMRNRQSLDDFSEDFDARVQAFETLNWNKRRRVIGAALAYIARNNIHSDSCQLDAIVITFRNLSHKEGQPFLEDVTVFHVPRAFSDL